MKNEDIIKTNTHAGKTYPYTPYTRITGISVSPVNTHLVFEIPKRVFRLGAISFNDFASDPYSTQFRKLFLFFLDYMHRLSSMAQKDSDDEEFSKIVILLEHDPEMKCYRFHVFSQREMDPYFVIRSQLQANKTACKKLKALNNYQKHYTITSQFDYVTKIANVYCKTQKFSLYTDDALKSLDRDHPLYPTNIFSLDHTSISDRTKYETESGYKFPNEKNLLRLPPTFIKPECFSERYFPHYYKTVVASPEVLVHENNNCTVLEIDDSPQRLSVEETLNRKGFRLNDNCWKFVSNYVDEILDVVKENGFRIMSANRAENTSGDTYMFFKYTPLMEGHQFDVEDCISFSV